MTLHDVRALLGHAEWADALVWDAVLAHGRQDDELHEKLHHLHMVQWAYLHIWRSEKVTVREPGTFPTLDSIRAWARDYYRALPDYLASLKDDRLSGTRFTT